MHQLVDAQRDRARLIPYTTLFRSADLRADIRTETNEPTERKYTVKAGDTLSAISKEYYGDPNQYNKIFEANKDILSDPDKDRKSTRLNSSHVKISYAVFCLKKKRN